MTSTVKLAVIYALVGAKRGGRKIHVLWYVCARKQGKAEVSNGLEM